MLMHFPLRYVYVLSDPSKLRYCLAHKITLLLLHTSMTTEDLGTKLKSDDFVIVYVKEHVQV